MAGRPCWLVMQSDTALGIAVADICKRLGQHICFAFDTGVKPYRPLCPMSTKQLGDEIRPAGQWAKEKRSQDLFNTFNVTVPVQK